MTRATPPCSSSTPSAAARKAPFDLAPLENSGAAALPFWPPDLIAAVTHCPADAIAANWPLVYTALAAADQASRPSCAAAIGTIAIETASTFRPIHEFGDAAYFERMYGPGSSVGRQLGNLEPGDGARYPGRGYIQLTGRANYRRYGTLLGVDLEADPDLALDPDIAARVFAAYWQGRDIQSQADQEDWAAVRRSVQGGSAGLDRLIQICQDLLA